MSDTPIAPMLSESDAWPRVLIVDDLHDNREILRRRMMAARFEVETASDGRECLEKLDSARFDIILLDYMMPEMDGIETLTALRKKWSKAELPVIMVTARDDDPIIVKAFDLGANDFVSKPFSFPVLLARARAQLDKAAA